MRIKERMRLARWPSCSITATRTARPGGVAARPPSLKAMSNLPVLYRPPEPDPDPGPIEHRVLVLYIAAAWLIGWRMGWAFGYLLTYPLHWGRGPRA
jgi:hypothetical protein